MNRNVTILLASLATALALAILVGIGDAGGYAAPGEYGLIYNYQNLIGGVAVLVGALVAYNAARNTVRAMRDDQRQQREHFEKQMDALIRPYRLLVSRETAVLLPQLRGELAEIQVLPSLSTAPFRGQSTRGQRVADTMKALCDLLEERNFSSLLELLDDDFMELKGRLTESARNALDDVFKAFTGRRANVPGGYTWRSMSGEEEIRLLRSRNLVQFPEIERDLAGLIGYLQRLRTSYGLPLLGLRHDSWRVRRSAPSAP